MFGKKVYVQGPKGQRLPPGVRNKPDRKNVGVGVGG